MIPALVIVTGLPCSGKTSLANLIASHLSLPIITKDNIKEILFDSLGWEDREWSQKLGMATYALMFHLLEELLSKKVSLLVESNFSPGRDDRKLLEIQARTPFYPIQINCYAEGKVLVDRFRKRTGQRHPGHVDSQVTIGELEQRLFVGRLGPLEVGGTVIEVDTSDFTQVDPSKIIAKIRIAMGSRYDQFPKNQHICLSDCLKKE